MLLFGYSQPSVLRALSKRAINTVSQPTKGPVDEATLDYEMSTAPDGAKGPRRFSSVGRMISLDARIMDRAHTQMLQVSCRRLPGEEQSVEHGRACASGLCRQPRIVGQRPPNRSVVRRHGVTLEHTGQG